MVVQQSIRQISRIHYSIIGIPHISDSQSNVKQRPDPLEIFQPRIPVHNLHRIVRIYFEPGLTRAIESILRQNRKLKQFPVLQNMHLL